MEYHRGLSPDFFTLATVDDNGPSARTLVLRVRSLFHLSYFI